MFRRQLWQAIDALPEVHRTPFLLREMEGYSYREIAKALGLEEGTVKSRLALEEIVKAEKIVVDEEEIEAEYKRMSEQYEVDLEQIKNFIPSERLTEDIAVDKALKYVMANAKITTKRATKA